MRDFKTEMMIYIAVWLPLGLVVTTNLADAVWFSAFCGILTWTTGVMGR